jgi:hypothetical protein
MSEARDKHIEKCNSTFDKCIRDVAISGGVNAAGVAVLAIGTVVTGGVLGIGIGILGGFLGGVGVGLSSGGSAVTCRKNRDACIEKAPA